MLFKEGDLVEYVGDQQHLQDKFGVIISISDIKYSWSNVGYSWITYEVFFPEAEPSCDHYNYEIENKITYSVGETFLRSYK